MAVLGEQQVERVYRNLRFLEWRRSPHGRRWPLSARRRFIVRLHKRLVSRCERRLSKAILTQEREQ